MVAQTKKAACHVLPSLLTQRLHSMATLMPHFTLEQQPTLSQNRFVTQRVDTVWAAYNSCTVKTLRHINTSK